ncbi:putative F-box protein At2g02030 [Papaver somniferum]|uniref:putative F-box protein At2g02030 n=1 Tax=Papaver somniferum TaxID=3469 RepID=UPI000E6F8BCE|nr:putative F-box protein At2g02030 [Papaver somniferum]
MDEFHGDSLVLCDVLSRLDVGSLMRFKSVSKPWRSLMEKNTHLINLHLTQLEKRRCGDMDTALIISQFHDVHRNALSEETAHPIAECEETESSWYRAGFLLPTRRSGSEEVVACDPYLSYFPVEETVLEPVYGLIRCANYGGVLIRNPITGETTSWIYTRTHEAVMSCGEEQGTELEDKPEEEAKEKLISVDFMFAFGYDPITKQHSFMFGCEVMTVGENTWRTIDEFPPSIAISQSRKSVYMNGSIYWMCDDEVCLPSENKLIMVFNVGRETFREILIPCYVHENLGHTMVLGEVDGKIAIAACQRYRGYYDNIRFWIYENVSDQEQLLGMTANINSTGTGTSYNVIGGNG